MLTSILRNEVGFAAFACVLGRNEMPALLGYLVAITVLLGTGYTGLEWLVSPDNPSTRQNLSDKQNLPHAGLKKSAANGAGTKEAVPSAKDGSPRTAPSDNADKAGPEEAKVADSGRDGENQKLEKSNENPDAVPSGGCKPIGLTANGEMVFPLQCGALIEHQRGPAAVGSPPPVQAASAPTRIEADVSGKPERRGGAVTDATEKNTQANPTSVSNVETESQTKRNTLDRRYSAESTPASIPNENSATVTIKPRNSQKLESDRHKRVTNQKFGSDHRKLVLMRLETLEFSDGHREQRLVPTSQSPATLQSEWYNPLGLR